MCIYCTGLGLALLAAPAPLAARAVAAEEEPPLVFRRAPALIPKGEPPLVPKRKPARIPEGDPPLVPKGNSPPVPKGEGSLSNDSSAAGSPSVLSTGGVSFSLAETR